MALKAGFILQGIKVILHIINFLLAKQDVPLGGNSDGCEVLNIRQ
jgi:hypothetical protein